jgi:predicted nucleotidyltransferase
MDHSPKPGEITSRFEKLLVALAADRVDFAVVGGLAVIFNGYPRLTLDVDILVHDAPENLRKLLDCLAGWGEGWARELKPEDFVFQEGSIRVMEEFDLDIFTRMNGRSLDDFRPRLRHLEIGGVRIPYLAPEDLIFLKQGSWRDKDKLDVQAMQEIIARESH